MITPTVHLNGTSAEELGRQFRAVYSRVGIALIALRDATPNGRDYYVQSPDAFSKAMREHEARLAALVQLREDMLELYNSTQESN